MWQINYGDGSKTDLSNELGGKIYIYTYIHTYIHMALNQKDLRFGLELPGSQGKNGNTSNDEIYELIDEMKHG